MAAIEVLDLSSTAVANITDSAARTFLILMDGRVVGEQLQLISIDEHGNVTRTRRRDEFDPDAP